MATSTLIAYLLERIAYRPLRNAPRLIPLITRHRGLFLSHMFFAGSTVRVPGLSSGQGLGGPVCFLGASNSEIPGLVIVAAACSCRSLCVYPAHQGGQSHTGRLGRQRGVIPYGIDVDKMISTTLYHRGAAAGAAGCFTPSCSSRCTSSWGSFPESKPSQRRSSAASETSRRHAGRDLPRLIESIGRACP